MPNVVVLDYGLARPQRLANALQSLGLAVNLTKKLPRGGTRSLLVLPDGMDDERSLTRGIEQSVMDELTRHIEKKRALLAVGLGALLLSQGYHDNNISVPGTAFFDASALRFERYAVDAQGTALKTPHMGFSFVVGLDRNPLIGPVLSGDKRGAWLYFRHRLYLPARIPNSDVAVAHHGVPFAGAIWRDNILACQFLPELSGTLGLSLLTAWCKNFT